MQTQKILDKDSQRVWHFDPAYTTVEFTVKKLFLFTVRGSFSDVKGSIVLDENNVKQSAVVAAIKAANIKTGNTSRDQSLCSKDFLDVSAHPLIEFESSQVIPGRDRDTLDVTGVLTIKGQSCEVKLVVNEVDRSKAPSGEEFVYYSAVTELDRFALGIKGMPGLIGRVLKVTINVQALSTLNESTR
jgi:polyisoprenoid-binding protein YceI